MNAVLERIDFSPYMTDTNATTLTLRLSAELKRKLETDAAAAHFSVDEYVLGLIEEAMFINSPEFFDPTNWEAREYRLVRASKRSVVLGHSVPLEDVIKEVEQRFGAVGPSDLPSKP